MPVASAKRRLWQLVRHSSPPRRRRDSQIEDRAGLFVIDQHAVAAAQMRREAVVMLEPPALETRQNQELGTLSPRRLELLDRALAVGRVVTEVLAGLVLAREVPGRRDFVL